MHPASGREQIPVGPPNYTCGENPLAYSDEESGNLNDQTVRENYVGPKGTVLTKTYQYTIIRSDIDVDTNRDGTITIAAPRTIGTEARSGRPCR